jgi:hypothetical protein
MTLIRTFIHSAFSGFCLSIAGSLVAGAPAHAFEGDQPFVCAFDSMVQCDENQVCYTIDRKQQGVAPFIEVDPAGGVARSAGPGALGQPIAIKNQESAGGTQIIQAVTDGSGEYGVMAVSMSIGGEDGVMTLAATHVSGAFIGYGSCLNK